MRRTLATAAIATLALVGVAAPASADHFTSTHTTATGTTCQSGALASGTGQELSTDRVRVKTSRGVRSWTCTFRNVGASTEEENGYFDYTPPTEVARYTSFDNCWDFDEAGNLVAVGDADITSKPNGTITIRCTLVPIEA